MSNLLTDDKLYDELVDARHQLVESTRLVASLRAELSRIHAALDANAHRSVAWSVESMEQYLEISMKLDPALLSSAYDPREVFSAAGSDMLKQLWKTYRGGGIPK